MSDRLTVPEVVATTIILMALNPVTLMMVALAIRGAVQ